MLHKKHLWRQIPPAIFPITLGFMGLSLGWRNASDVLPIPQEIGNLMLGISTAYFLFFAILYVAKIFARPAVVLEDLKTPQLRAGVATFPMTIMLLAAVLLILGVQAPTVWWTGVVLYFVVNAVVVYLLITGPPEARIFTPFQYLVFVGLIVAPIAGIPLGLVAESLFLTIAAMIPYVAITMGYGYKLTRIRPPMSLRATLAIFLAPTSLFALAFGGMEINWAFDLFYWMAVAIAVVLLVLSRWLTEGGFNLVWGSFTFPIATFINLNIYAIGEGMGLVATTGMFAGLIIGTPLILYIVWKTSKLWIRGELANNTKTTVT